jgi:uncharacterized protein (TIGR03086 family)
MNLAERHLDVCCRFGEVVTAAAGRWSRPSPCPDWDARAVVEHVIGFHDVLLLRPLGAKPERPRHDPERRWWLTYDALRELFTRPGLLDGPVGVPAIGNNPAAQLDASRLVSNLTQDVLVHSWDLARAVGADDRLDPQLCAFFYEHLPADQYALSASGMFGPPVPETDDADIQWRLLARLGRDPDWRAP